MFFLVAKQTLVPPFGDKGFPCFREMSFHVLWKTWLYILEKVLVRLLENSFCVGDIIPCLGTIHPETRRIKIQLSFVVVETETFKVSEAEMREMLALETKFSVEEILLYRSVAR